MERNKGRTISFDFFENFEERERKVSLSNYRENG